MACPTSERCPTNSNRNLCRGRTLIFVDELGEDGYPAFQGASTSLEIGADMNGIGKDGIGKDEIEAFFKHYQSLKVEEAKNAENVGAGEEAQGASQK